jgi:hypothetical protein
MLLIRLVLVPFWQGAPPAEFRSWFARHSGRIRSMMVPLGATSVVASGGGAVARLLRDEELRAEPVVAAAAAAGVVAVTVAVNEPANRRFVEEDLTDEQTRALLARWVRWHDVRVVVGVAGALAAVMALAR